MVQKYVKKRTMIINPIELIRLIACRQVMLSDSFKQASHKIGATIGFEVAEDDNSVKAAPPPPVEVADVHMNVKESESGKKIAPKAKQEDVDL